jgi:predicted nucleotidyltransferase
MTLTPGTAPGTVRVTDGAEGLNGSDHDAFSAVLARTIAVLAEAGIDFAVLGGVASAGYGRARWTKDIDVFVRPEDADPALDALGENGFAIDRINPAWIYKANRDGVQVDLIFKGKGGIFLDDRMLGHVRPVTLAGIEVPAIGPEDLVVMKALSHDEETPRHWYDALAVLARQDLDWEYLTARASSAPRRVLSLLLYATSNDLWVPAGALRQIGERVLYDREVPWTPPTC